MTGKDVQLLLRATLITGLLLVAACATAPPPAPEPVVDTPVTVIPEPQPAPVIPAPATAADTPPLIEPAGRPTQVAIVLSNREPAYEQVAAELEKRLDDYTLFDLGDRSQPPISAFRRIADSDAAAVVAIGLRAALSASSMAEVPVVFCQVFNYEANGLINASSRGVSALPPLDLQIAAWKKVDPSLKRIGAILGEGHESLIEEAQLAAATHDVELHIRTVKSDRETQYVFNRLVNDIDGFWLFPDNRILSKTVLDHIVRYAARRRVQVAVFNDSLLPMGAALSSSATEANIAETIVAVLEDIERGEIDDLPPVTSLSDVRVVTNEELLEEFRLAQSGDEAATAQVIN